MTEIRSFLEIQEYPWHNLLFNYLLFVSYKKLTLLIKNLLHTRTKCTKDQTKQEHYNSHTAIGSSAFP